MRGFVDTLSTMKVDSGRLTGIEDLSQIFIRDAILDALFESKDEVLNLANPIEEKNDDVELAAERVGGSPSPSISQRVGHKNYLPRTRKKREITGGVNNIGGSVYTQSD